MPLALALAGLGVIGAIAMAFVAGGSGATSATTVAPPPPPIATTPLPPPIAVVPVQETPPVVPAVVAPAPGTLTVRVSTAGAIVRVGERTLAVGELGTAIAMPPGTYLVHVEHPQYRPFDREITVVSGADADIDPELVPRAPVAAPGRISINTRPWSKVYVGSRLLGTTPIGEAQVPSGSVRLRIVDRDGRTFSRSVRVSPGAEESVFYDLDAE